ncbi:site-specific integrase [Burkholderia multivorans]|uniref:site-specific integrase n=1 Tax=Burkholderia multivorans TaxID=87883 RepID=UPI0020195FA3|nr:site-specific integrase [Burkholderia multivorans]MCL4659587.1 site-specific integrase [Burkholderia multivorans]MCO1354083.1 site-specific integrase [Burkholderia multivorans]MCO1412034.1 site-specific integrase [Burkholderia multivorans]MCO1447806.1 site-specific integrase [Burkholderia multivorans]UQP45144.1 site-specific integrase [Burkholderia multivorans]
MTSLPRGIQPIEWTNKDGTITRKYRVKIVRKDFKSSKNFDNLDEAKEFLALSKVKKGKEIIYNITEEERVKREAQKQEKSSSSDFSFGYFVQRYIEDYVLTKPLETELHQRNRNNILSFYKTILNTSIVDRNLTNQEKQEMGLDIDYQVSRFMKALDIRKIKSIEINLYIKERLKKVKPQSVSRELSYIANVFNKLQYFNEELADLPNPVYTYDKDLLKNRTVKREFTISEEDEKKLFEELSKKKNQELFKIAKISLLTSLRRSEILTLTFSQIKENYIQLIHTKSGRPRKVYLTKEAKAYLDTMERLPNTDNLFKYTIGGFDRVFRQFMKDHNLGHIHFHDLRRLNISRTILKIGAENSVFITEFLGLQSVKKFETLHIETQATEITDQKKALYTFGHSQPQTTKIYFNIGTLKKN